MCMRTTRPCRQERPVNVDCFVPLLTRYLQARKEARQRKRKRKGTIPRQHCEPWGARAEQSLEQCRTDANKSEIKTATRQCANVPWCHGRRIWQSFNVPGSLTHGHNRLLPWPPARKSTLAQNLQQRRDLERKHTDDSLLHNLKTANRTQTEIIGIRQRRVETVSTCTLLTAERPRGMPVKTAWLQ